MAINKIISKKERNTKPMKRSISLLLLACLCLGLLCACGGGDSSEYRTDVSVNDIAAAVDTAIEAGDNMASVDANYILNRMEMDVSDYAEYVVKINAFGANVDEYGIFKAADEAQAAEIASAVEAYLQMRNDTWMTEYMPEERPKMEAASYQTAGLYVMYAVLWDEPKAAAFEAFTSALQA